MCFSMTGDGLPIAYTQEELYDAVVSLRSQIKKDKELLSELDILSDLHSLLVLDMIHSDLGLTHKLEAGLGFLHI